MQGIKHLIQCHCVLPTLRRLPDPVFHSFVVFSVLEDGGNVVPKDAACNNCGVIHRIVDICKSEITTKESSSAIISIDDIQLMIPTELGNLLKGYDCDIATWELSHFVYSEGKWGEKVVLTREKADGSTKGKVLTIEGPQKFKIESYDMSETF